MISPLPPPLLHSNKVVYGGTGFKDNKPLPEEIEHEAPDYSLYDSYIEHDLKHKPTYWNNYKNYSIGFSTRGCFRKCAFCVNRNYSKVEFHSNVSEWLDTSRKYIYLCDDNILGFKDWRAVFEELAETNKPFQFKQGLDIRLLTEEKAEVLSKAKYHGEFIFAFDDIKDKEIIEEKLKLWRKHCRKSTKFYVLAGFEYQDEREIISVFERVKLLSKYGCIPYFMRHKNYLNSKYRALFVHLARWFNMPQFFKKTTFREFCQANQAHKKTPGICSCLKALQDFEKDHPEIAKEYFDIKFFKV